MQAWSVDKCLPWIQLFWSCSGTNLSPYRLIPVNRDSNTNIIDLTAMSRLQKAKLQFRAVCFQCIGIHHSGWLSRNFCNSVLQTKDAMTFFARWDSAGSESTWSTIEGRWNKQIKTPSLRLLQWGEQWDAILLQRVRNNYILLLIKWHRPTGSLLIQQIHLYSTLPAVCLGRTLGTLCIPSSNKYNLNKLSIICQKTPTMWKFHSYFIFCVCNCKS